MKNRQLDPVRRGLVSLVVLSLLGVCLELASSRHWGSFVQILPWILVVLCGVALACILSAQPSRGIPLGRAIAAGVIVVSCFGFWEHWESNHASGALDFRYATTWSTFSVQKQWWMALNGSVGPAPPLVPLSLALIAALVFVVSLGGSDSHKSTK